MNIGHKKPHVDLVIPGLMNLPMYELDMDALKQATPSLHRLLRFAERQNVEVTDFDNTLINILGLNQSALPFAKACKDDQYKHCLLFKPVHLKADINNAIVFPVESEQDDSDIIINDLSSFFKEDCKVEKLADNLWIMQLSTCEPVKELPHYLSAVGKKVTHYIEQTKTNLDWFKLFNEMQMFMYQHPVNQRRMQNGQLSINSLWCWGADDYAGEFIDSMSWFSDDIEIRQLGNLFTQNTYELSALNNADIKGNVVIVELSLLKALKSGQDSDLLSALTHLEKQCFEPVMTMPLSSLKVTAASTTDFFYRPHFAFKFWKRECWQD